MAQMVKKKIQKKPTSPSKGELNRGQGVTKSGFNGGQTSGGGISRTQGKKRDTVKGALQAAVRVGTLGYSAMAEEAVKKNRAKKTK